MKHTPEQITAKLGEAQALAAAGKTQVEIAKVLGISVMTFHRWRNARAQRCAAITGPGISGEAFLIPEAVDEPDTINRIVELQIENVRLRKLVTDLLLEKMRLEEDAHTSLAPGNQLALLQKSRR